MGLNLVMKQYKSYRKYNLSVFVVYFVVLGVLRVTVFFYSTTDTKKAQRTQSETFYLIPDSTSLTSLPKFS
jgi:hypothetical protein